MSQFMIHKDIEAIELETSLVGSGLDISPVNQMVEQLRPRTSETKLG